MDVLATGEVLCGILSVVLVFSLNNGMRPILFVNAAMILTHELMLQRRCTSPLHTGSAQSSIARLLVCNWKKESQPFLGDAVI